MNTSKSHPDLEPKCCGRSSRFVLLLAIAMVQYGVAISSTAAAAPRTNSLNEIVLHRFTGLNRDGVNPLSTPLVRDASGNLYGMTQRGGAFGCGSVFELTSSGKVKVLHSFRNYYNCGDIAPSGQIAMDANGFLYGTTHGDGQYGFGTIFRLTTKGRGFTTLYSFTGGADGALPTSGVILDTAGNLYGTTWNDGAYGDGTLFQLTAAGTLNVLYNFGANANDGGFALGLVMDSQGNIYGTDLLGGPYANSNCLQTSYVLQFGCGVVFKVDPSGQETLLHVFSGINGDGGSPAGPPMLDSTGNLYGTTLVGGTGTCPGSWFPTGGCGTVFEIDAQGNYTVLYSFPGTGGKGAGPVGNLVMDSTGSLYGATEDGGSGNCLSGPGGSGGYYSGYSGCGVTFKLDAAGTETVLHRFSGLKDGGNPESGVIEDSAGNLYGTTYSGGAVNKCGSGYGCGTVFELAK